MPIVGNAALVSVADAPLNISGGDSGSVIVTNTADNGWYTNYGQPNAVTVQRLIDAASQLRTWSNKDDSNISPLGWTYTPSSIVGVTGAGAAANTITFNTAATSTTAGWVVIPGSADWDHICAYGNYITAKRTRPSKLAPQPARNHKGTVARSYHHDKQFSNADPAELVALQLLRKMVQPDDFKRYLRHGFVPVRAASGLVYQVHRRQNIAVWDCGEKIATLCVHLRGPHQVPLTDEVVGKMLIVEYDEADIWRRSNITWQGLPQCIDILEKLGVDTTKIPKTFDNIRFDADGIVTLRPELRLYG